ncbi:hypothetical protein [Acetobacter conturbans]|uniref:GNAT family acetyltransferase n=1 Tax=Acetobacter conturbans TaxID=1737472 RepID=A0ABX0K477_9PROT|nr:hypothetical protein [Acetobacter conturbans]NHN89015.1 hypothetical protein [Acetobacter conturbans]
MKNISRFVFACSSIILIVLAFILIGFGVFDLFETMGRSWHNGRNTVLVAISYVVIAIAIFDVAKYFIEEEVIRSVEKQGIGEARTSLTKFITTIIIAVFVEGLVGVFEAGNKEPQDVMYPASLLVVATFIVLVLGVYQRLSVVAEKETQK